MSILITGGAGYIGRHTAKHLYRAGLEVVALDNLSSSNFNDFAWGPLVVGDISDTGLVASLIREHGVSAVIHLAASAHVGESVRNPGLYFRNNVAGSLSMLDAMVAEGVSQIVFASTCAVYGAVGLAREDGPVQPESPYGESKLQIERSLSWYSGAYGMRSVSLRYFNVAGAEEGLGEDVTTSVRIIPRTINATLDKERPLYIFGEDLETPDGTAVRDYVHVSDVARANLLALEYLARGESGAVLNIASGKGVSVREIVRVAGQTMNATVSHKSAPARVGDPASVVADISQSKRVLGWNPLESDLDSIIGSVVKRGISR